MERKSVIAITDMLYNRTEKHAKVGGVLINTRMYGGGRKRGDECYLLYFFTLEDFL